MWLDTYHKVWLWDLINAEVSLYLYLSRHLYTQIFRHFPVRHTDSEAQDWSQRYGKLEFIYYALQQMSMTNMIMDKIIGNDIKLYAISVCPWYDLSTEQMYVLCIHSDLNLLSDWKQTAKPTAQFYPPLLQIINFALA